MPIGAGKRHLQMSGYSLEYAAFRAPMPAVHLKICSTDYRNDVHMLTIRLALGGSKKRPFYHLTVTDSRNPRDGSHKEQVGFFNPVARGQEVRLSVNEERVTYWLSVGAQPSERVAQLLKENAKAAA
jgi:small subunit ribosomal protein S16